MVTDVFCSKYWHTPEWGKTRRIYDSPSPYSFIVRLNVVTDMFKGNTSRKIDGKYQIENSFTVIITISVFTEEFNEKPQLRQSNKFEKV